MSQDASTRQTLVNSGKNGQSPTWSEPSSSGVSAGATGFSVESYADRLMDELFDDVEQALDMRSRLPEQLVPLTVESEAEPEPAPYPRVADSLGHPAPNPPAYDLSSPLQPERPEPGLPLALQSLQELLPPEDRSLLDPSLTHPAPVPPRKPESSKSYDRLLLGVGCASIILTLALWLLSQEVFRKPVPIASSPTNTVATSPTPPASDTGFADYLQRAVEALDQKAQPGTGTVAMAPIAVPSTAPMPTVAVPPTPRTATAGRPVRTPTGLERIYIPVYQMPPNLIPGNTAVAPLTTVRPNPGAVAKPPAQPAPVTAATIPKKLVAVLDMGNDNSAVLVEINGVVQRFRVGESIGSTGWTLVEVSKNQAIMRRNGEVRSVFVEQTF